MTRFLMALVLTAAGLALTAGDAAAFGGRMKKSSCAPACPTACAPACPMPCAPVHHCAAPCAMPAPVVHHMPAPCAMPCAAPVVHHCAPACPAPVCCDPCAKPARMGLLKRLCNRNKCD